MKNSEIGKKEEAKICPKCGSSYVRKNIGRYRPSRQELAKGKKEPSLYYCKKCKHKF